MTPLSVADLPFAPPTGTHLSFLSCPPDAAARAFVAIQMAEGRSCVSLPCPPEDVPVSLTRLEPLSFPGQRHLFIPTATPGWTAYFNSYALGTNASSVLPGLAQALKCRAVLIEAVPLGTNGEASEALGLTVLDPEGSGWRRSVGLRNTEGFWRFWQLGEPFAFEEVDRYRLRRRRRRFDLPMLTAYASALGLRPFQTGFYQSGGPLVTCDPRQAR